MLRLSVNGLLLGNVNMKNTRQKITTFILVFVPVFSYAVFTFMPASAAQTITVNSKADTLADDGVCTLREAITAANTNTASGATPGECIAGDAGTDTINFNITGTADFTNGGQDGYTIQPQSALPTIEETVIINGYSQPGSSANTAVAPAALNGTILIEINGSAVDSFLVFNGGVSGSAGSSVRGLAINRFTGTALHIVAHNVTIAGNYIGTAADGSTDLGNGFAGITNAEPRTASTGAIIGGLNPEDRNIISGNESAAVYPRDNWVIQGNYIGVDRTGMTKLANSVFSTGAGGLSIDDCTGVVVGGAEEGAVNVISGNNNQGIAPDRADDLVIQGNYIGVGADGVTSIPNDAMGIDIKASDNVLVGGSAAGEGNALDSNTLSGIDVQASSSNIILEANEITGSGNDGVKVENANDTTTSFNDISQSGRYGINIQTTDGAIIEGNNISQSGQSGIVTQTIQGLTVEGNEVFQSTQDGIDVQTTDGVVIDDNLVADNDSEGIIVDGASTSVELTGNTSDSNGSYGISIAAGQTGALISGNTVTNAASQGGIIGNGIEDSIIDGNIVEDNEFVGIVLTSGSTSNAISNNQVARNLGTGVNIAGGSTNNEVVGNEIFDNSGGGINIDNSNDNLIGGSTASDRNVVFGHASSNINISGFGGISNGNVVQGNFIGVPANGQPDDSISQASGVSLSGSAQYNLVGGTGSGEGNRIVGNTVSGIQSTAITITGFGSFTPSSNTFIGNSVYGNEAGSINGFGAPGLGIELLNINVDGGFVPQSADSDGPDINDPSDVDTGTNNYMNYPVINSASQNLLNLNVNFEIDAADSPTNQYRVEFFANDTADPSGYGEGQTYLGSTTVSPGNDMVANLTLPSGTNLTGKVLSATTTAIDGTTNSGFGSTSEFSLVSNIDIIALPQEPTSTEGVLANTGQNITALLAIAAGLWGLSVAIVKRQHRSYSLSK